MHKLLMSSLLLIVCFCPSFSQTSMRSEMDTIAVRIVRKLNLNKTSTLSVTTMDEDRNYMINVRPMLDILQASLQKSVKTVRFNSFQGQENAVVRELYIRSASSLEYKQFDLDQKELDTLILTCHLFVIDKNTVNYIFKLFNLKSVVLYQSPELELTRDAAIPSVRRVIFKAFANEESFQAILYRGKIIEKLEKLFSSRNSNFLAHPAVYYMSNNFPYAVRWQVEQLKEILSIRYGISFSEETGNKIMLDQAGTLTFLRGNVKRSISKIVDTEPLIADDFPEEKNTYHYFGSSRENKTEARKATTSAEKNILKRIYEILETKLPNAYNPFNYSLLKKIYRDNGKCILKGRKISENPVTGEEKIQYKWVDRDEYLSKLRKMYKHNFTFDVDLKVMGVFQDPIDQNRYWAIVKQTWKTRKFGHTVYKDDGFLFMNFDFKADLVLRDFGIYYRLWFYDYKYDDVERQISRVDKISADIENHFVRGVKRIDKNLKMELKRHLLAKIKHGSITPLRLQ